MQQVAMKTYRWILEVQSETKVEIGGDGSYNVQVPDQGLLVDPELKSPHVAVVNSREVGSREFWIIFTLIPESNEA